MCLWEAGSVEINADDENVAADDESDASDDEEAMEVDGNASTDVTMEMEEAPATKVKAQAAPKLSTAVSGLPQSAEELESLIGLIHQTVNESVLPRLHKCLNAKVRCTRTCGCVCSFSKNLQEQSDGDNVWVSSR